MKSIKLTKKEKEIFESLAGTPGGFLFKHIKPSGTVCYRLMDKDRNPIANHSEAKVQELINKGVLEIDNMGIVTKATLGVE
jgi:hypothetical protein